MYSYEDRIRAVKLYIKLGKRTGPTIRQLGYPTKNAFKSWYRETYALSELFVELDLARSSYFYHRAQLRGADKYADARLAITEVFECNHRCYRYRRMRAALGRRQVFISEKVVQRLMKQECLVVAANRRRRYGSYLGEISPAPENLINRDFQAATPNEKWLTDITEFQIPAGKVYLSPMIDCFDGLVVSWSLTARMRSSYEYMNYLQVVQVFVRPPLGQIQVGANRQALATSHLGCNTTIAS